MSMQDPIADMLVRIKNAQAVFKSSVGMPKSTLKIALAEVLEDEGYIAGFSEEKKDNNPWLTIELKYFEGAPVIRKMTRVSTPGMRVYCDRQHLPEVENGLGIAVVSTSQGVMTAQNAAQVGLGGEVLCYVS
ncbi:MAG TPA: 30S ribosomal protein S8 [Coxiellaceae bacterium]|nr:30S ribosomal protein S8 [Coxiellaceae bacterium]